MNIDFSRHHQWAGILTNSGITAKKVYRSWWVASRRLNFMMSNDRNELVSSTKYVAMHCNVWTQQSDYLFQTIHATVDPSPKAELSHTARVDAVFANENKIVLLFLFFVLIFFCSRFDKLSDLSGPHRIHKKRWDEILHGISLNGVSSKLRGWWPLLFLVT